MLRQRGAEVIDADDVQQSLLKPGLELAAQLVARFGRAILHPDGWWSTAPPWPVWSSRRAAPRCGIWIRSPIPRLSVRSAAGSRGRRRRSWWSKPLQAFAIRDARRCRRALGRRRASGKPPAASRASRAHLDRETAEQRLAAAADPLLGGACADAVIDTSGDIDEMAANGRECLEGPRDRVAIRAVKPRPRGYASKGGTLSDRVEVDVHFDYAVLVAQHSATRWLEEVRRQVGPDQLAVTWRFFPLEEGQRTGRRRVSDLELPPDRRSRGRDSLRAAAARDVRARHSSASTPPCSVSSTKRARSAQPATLEEAATRAGLDMAEFSAGLEDPSLLDAIRDDYLQGRSNLGVFGTPTFVFPNGQSGLHPGLARAAPGGSRSSLGRFRGRRATVRSCAKSSARDDLSE